MIGLKLENEVVQQGHDLTKRRSELVQSGFD